MKTRSRPYSQKEMLDLGAGGHLSRAYMRYIPIDLLDGLEPVPANSDSDDGLYHKGRKIENPIEVIYDANRDRYMVYAGNHRIAQAKTNGQTHILAFVEPDMTSGYPYIGPHPLTEDPDAELVLGFSTEASPAAPSP